MPNREVIDKKSQTTKAGLCYYFPEQKLLYFYY